MKNKKIHLLIICNRSNSLQIFLQVFLCNKILLCKVLITQKRFAGMCSNRNKKEGIKVTDQEYMFRAIQLAKQGEGWTTPSQAFSERETS